MKKLFTVMLVLALALSLAACGGKDAADETEPEEIIEDETAEEEEEEQPAEMPQELVGSWQLDQERSSGPASASLEIVEDGSISFFLGGGYDGEGQITMEEGKAVAHTVSYLEGVEYSFVLTPEEYDGEPCVKMELEDGIFYWVASSPASQEDEIPGRPVYVEEDFTACLDDIGKYVQLGTPAAFRSAVEQAAYLMDWASTSSMTPSDVIAAFNAKFATLDNEGKSTFLMQLEQVDGAYKQLQTAGQEELLAEAGVRDCGYPWADADFSGIEALMTAAGHR
ncbi:MAG: hypothetical protein IKG74_07060 [Firmicutes bacterium]|nr:hypothetical protein [Bacillota bacterium]